MERAFGDEFVVGDDEPVHEQESIPVNEDRLGCGVLRVFDKLADLEDRAGAESAYPWKRGGSATGTGQLVPRRLSNPAGVA